jgi:hypothetical protein
MKSIVAFLVASVVGWLFFALQNMVVTMTARGASAAVSAGGISKARLNTCQIQITDSAGPNGTFLNDWMVYGTSVASPATFAGIANALSKQITTATVVQASQATPAIFTLTQSGLDFSAMTLSDHVWACYYKQTVAPATTDVPAVTVDLGALGA